MVGGRRWRYGEREREREGRKELRAQCLSVAVFGPAQLCGFTAAFHCLGRPRNRSSTPCLPPSLPPPLVSPPSSASCHLSSPRSWRPPPTPLPPLSTLSPLLSSRTHPVFPLLEPLLPVTPPDPDHPLLSSHQCNVLFCSAFLPYTASKVTLSRGRCARM